MESKLIYVGGPSDRGVVRWHGAVRYHSVKKTQVAMRVPGVVLRNASTRNGSEISARPLLNGIHVAARPLCDIHFLVTA